MTVKSFIKKGGQKLKEKFPETDFVNGILSKNVYELPVSTFKLLNYSNRFVS